MPSLLPAHGLVPRVLIRAGSLLLALSGLAATSAGVFAADPVRGIILSTHTDGSDWAGPEVGSTMRDLRAVGATWVAIHPYAGLAPDGAVRFHRVSPEDPAPYLTIPIREAHAAGLKIFITPHIAYWGTSFSWRGAVRFDTEAEWARFFSTYEAWLVNLVESCPDADAFCVGSELDSTLSRETEWRRLIARVRERTRAPLTYAANWDDFRRVPFWDQLDVIGIQAYFPLSDVPDPGRPRLEAAWDSLMVELRAYSGALNRRIVFTELGYNRAYAAPVRPWDPRGDGPEAERVQSACLDVALRAVEKEDAVVGAFLWKWFPNPRPVGRNFQLATPGIRAVIARDWGD